MICAIASYLREEESLCICVEVCYFCIWGQIHKILEVFVRPSVCIRLFVCLCVNIYLSTDVPTVVRLPACQCLFVYLYVYICSSTSVSTFVRLPV